MLKDYEKPEDLLSENGLLQQLTKALVKRELNGELTHHLGYKKHDPPATTQAIRETAGRRKF